ncbi:hypothetical protein DFP73DRAFT_601779 [Morchella snyderi]|nr:hypothetical protein DFP73DRAFT_601779 [Morchella snyderi]
MGKMRNLPALDAGGQILAELRILTLRILSDYNAVARLMNNTMTIMTDNQLIPLKNKRNEDIPDFPMTLVDIDRANSGELNRLLESYGLPTVGTVAVRKAQLKRYLGITVVAV